jgi:hypothetical protein
MYMRKLPSITELQILLQLVQNRGLHSGHINALSPQISGLC